MRRPRLSRRAGWLSGPGPAYDWQHGKSLRRAAARNKAQSIAASARGGASETSFSKLVASESRSAGVAGGLAQLLFYAEELVVFGDAVGAGGAPGFDLAGAHANGEVGDEGVFGFAAAVRNDRSVFRLAGHFDGFDCFGHAADLIQLD